MFSVVNKNDNKLIIKLSRPLTIHREQSIKLIKQKA